MASTSTQYVNNAEGIGTPATVYYQYDGQGNRTRKVVEDQAPSRRRERRYIGEYETYWSTPYQGSATEINHTSVHISDETGRFVLLEFNGSTVSTRYQHSDHLGSSHIETAGDGTVISYEEYHPFGTTAYQALIADISRKRYRYCGKERDEESGLYYYGARYYASWLGRFVSVDALKDKYPQWTSYQYTGNNPVTFYDLDGNEPAENEKTNSSPSSAAITFGKETVWGKALSKSIEGMKHYNVPSGKNQGTIKEFKDVLKQVSADKKDGIGFLAVFSHGMGGKEDAGMIFANAEYHPKAGNVFTTDLVQLKDMMQKGELKFQEGAVIYLGACNAGTTDVNQMRFAQELANITGATVIGVANSGMEPKDPNNNLNVEFQPEDKKWGNIKIFESGKPPVTLGTGKEVNVEALAEATLFDLRLRKELNEPRPEELIFQ